MGHAQLLMAVLVTILVGVGIAVGISQFNEGAQVANRDAVAADCQKAIALAQQWYRKPTSLGGGGNSFTGLTLAKIGFGASNENGSYALTVVDTDNISVKGTGTELNSGKTAKLTVTVTYAATTGATTYADTF